MIFWHINLITFHGIVNLNFGIIIIEVFWIFLYYIAKLLLFKLFARGYTFFSLFVFSDLAFEIHVKYLVWDQTYLVGHLFSRIILILLFIY